MERERYHSLIDLISLRFGAGGFAISGAVWGLIRLRKGSEEERRGQGRERQNQEVGTLRVGLTSVSILIGEGDEEGHVDESLARFFTESDG